MGKPYIILVDDEEIILKSLRNEVREAFSKELYIEVASEANDAISLIKELEEEGEEVALIISDYIMPGKTGAEFLIEIHQSKPDIIKIMLTGQADLSGVQDTVNKANLYRFITKPWNQNDLALTIKEGLQTFNLKKELFLRNQELEELNQNLEQKVIDRTQKLNEAKEQLEGLFGELQEKNDQINKSINYAKRIQNAVLGDIPSNEEKLIDGFIYFAPRDVVSGDFYYITEKKENGHDKLIVAAADCTGHGVPGAFMSMIGQAQLNHVVHDLEIHSPGKILDLLDQNIFRDLNQELSFTHDGMDIALCCIDFQNQTLSFSGAKRPLLAYFDNQLHDFKGSKHSIGGYLLKDKKTSFEEISIPFPKKGGEFYLFSDGVQDQFGGAHNRKLGLKFFRELIENYHEKSMCEQKKMFSNVVKSWMKEGGERQIDDQLIIGFRLPPQ